MTAFAPFIHYTCSWKLYEPLLWPAVLNGYLHPKDYGLLEETGYAWNHDRKLSVDECNYERKDAYFNILREDPRSPERNTFVKDPALLPKVEAARAEKLMQRFSVDEKKRSLEKAEGFKFFYGFADSR